MIGHIDEIGLIVHHIDDDGYLWFTGVGGWDPVILVGQRVDVATRAATIPGVVGKKPIHLLEEERKQAPELRNLHVDIGAKDGDEARRMVRIGDVAVISGEPVEYPNGRVVSRAMDNRLGCCVAYEAARLVAEAGAPRRRLRRSRSRRRRSPSRGPGRRPTGSSRTSPWSSTSPSPPTAGHGREGARGAQVRLRPGDHGAARRWTPRSASSGDAARPRASRSR